MEDAAFYSAQVLNVLFAVGMMLLIRARVKRGASGKSNGKNVYTIVALFGGVVSGTFLYSFLYKAFQWAGFPQSRGHGEVIISAFIFNLAWAVVFVFIGRVVLSWRPMRW
jgi:hypothetical protein